jgi:DNA (cytosine-5)-methyltransferase 1
MGIASLFSGIGALELGLRRHLDLPLLLLCEINADAQRVLAAHFPGVPLHGDVRTLDALPAGTTVVTAGSPCTDLSSFGTCSGIHGAASSLVDQIFRLVGGCDGVHTVVMENVTNLVRLRHGEGVRHVTAALEALGFAWAYRVVDARDFGLLQSRRRVLLVAHRGRPPPYWLLHSNPATAPPPDASEAAFARAGFAGFYINEGKRGSSFRVGVAPTLKCNGNGARVQYGAHPHCLILPEDARADGARVVYLHVEDAERAQGLPPGWTAAAGHYIRRYARIGNSVPPPFLQFVGAGLAGLLAAEDVPPPAEEGAKAAAFDGPWPTAAHGAPGDAPVAAPRCTSAPSAAALALVDPVATRLECVADARTVSARAARGFAERAARGGAAMPEWAIAIVRAHGEVD